MAGSSEKTAADDIRQRGGMRGSMKKYLEKLYPRSVAIRLSLSVFALWIPFSILVIGSLRAVSLTQMDTTIRNQKENVSYFSAIINDDLDRVVSLLYILCGDTEVQNFVNRRDDSFDFQDYLAYYDAYSKLKIYRQTSMYIDDIFIFLPATQELLTANYSVISMDEDYQTMLDHYLDTGKSFFHRDDNMTYLLQGVNGITCGITISARHIRNTLRSYSDYAFYLVDSESGAMLDENSASELGRQIYRSIAGEEELPEEVTLDGSTYLVDRVRTPDNHFDIILYSDKDKIYENVYFIQRVWLCLSVLAVFIPLLIAGLLRRMLSRPMNKLVTAMQKVEQEVYDYKLPEDESQEFNYVFRQYNSMAAKVENLIQEVYEKQLQVEQAKLKQLQAQINPHFLFNSFYIGYRMAKSGSSEKVAQLCLYLGDYFKVLARVSDDFLSVREEMKFTETYLLLNQMRFEEKLSYEIDREEGLDGERMPPLLLQPVIENAIRHGVEKTSRMCMIRITVRRERAGLSFLVEDNCHTITQEALEEVRERLNSPVCPKQSFGLWNTQQRLKALHPRAEGLKFRITEDGWFQVGFLV